jgi:adenylate kinase
MIIAISGTPGIGKSTVCRILGKNMKGHVISLTRLLQKKKIRSRFDKKRKTRIVTTAAVRSAVIKEAKKGINIVDGHMSHFAKADLYIILRCRPDVLMKRMLKKKWPRDKVRENMRSEILDTVTIESLQIHPKNRVLEIDTTQETPSSAAKLIESLLNNYRKQKDYSVGRIDWSEKYSKYLVSQDYSMSG